MSSRKAGWALRKEYQDLLDKTKAMRKRIVKRAEELIKQHPDVLYCKKHPLDNDLISVSEYTRYFTLTPKAALSIIEAIEDWLADQHPHKQMKLYGDV